MPTAIFVAATPEKRTKDPPSVHSGGEVLGQHERADHLGVERQPDRVPVQVGRRPRARADAVETTWSTRAELFAESGDGGLVGQVDGLGGDAGLAGVGGGEGVLVAAGGDDVRSGVPGGEGDRAGDPAAPPDDQHGLVLAAVRS